MAQALSYEIVNVVVTSSLGTRLDCAHIVRYTPNCEYDPQRFAALKHRVRVDGAVPTFLVFGSGKVVCVGSPSEMVARRAVNRFLDHLQNIGVRIYDRSVTVQNIVSHACLNFPINLRKLAQERWEHCHYEPELFPGLKCTLAGSVCNIFASGKIVITGCTKTSQINCALATVQSFIDDFYIRL